MIDKTVGYLWDFASEASLPRTLTPETPMPLYPRFSWPWAFAQKNKHRNCGERAAAKAGTTRALGTSVQRSLVVHPAVNRLFTGWVMWVKMNQDLQG
jgi:hypothetical protein